ncbi:MAG: beta-ketoacyl-ACP synthase, partial [Fimbriimonadaceae bacterium]|nr:beta-ketoacyl-ACP synthase [Alphaproteobacteria bacterium]
VKSNNPGPVLNAALSNELRPTLFLAQLSNLLAGNISIVHGVTDSSRTFVGEEIAGVSAVETAVRQIQMNQGNIFLVGGATIAERADMIMTYEFGHTVWKGEYGPVWSRAGSDGGMILGSAGAFLILEARHHAEARGAKPYARIRKVLSDRCNRKPGAAKKVANLLFDKMSDLVPTGPLPILSGACGVEPYLSEERDFLLGLAEKGYAPSIRGVTTVFGNSLEAQFPVGVALAALAISNGTFYSPFDETGIENDYTAVPDHVLVSNWGHWRGEGLALIDTPSGALRGKA